MRCGHKSVSWLDFHLSLLFLHSRVMPGGTRFSFLDRSALQTITVENVQGTTSVPGILDLLAEVFEQASHLGEMRLSRSFADFPEQFYRTSFLAAQDPRDHVFGILGVSQFRGARLKADYSKSIPRVFSEAMAVVITEGFLFGYPRFTLHWGETSELPSWVPDPCRQPLVLSRTPSRFSIREIDRIEQAIERARGIAPIATFSQDFGLLYTAGIWQGHVSGYLQLPPLLFKELNEPVTFAHMVQMGKFWYEITRFCESHSVPTRAMLEAILGPSNYYSFDEESMASVWEGWASNPEDWEIVAMQQNIAIDPVPSTDAHPLTLQLPERVRLHWAIGLARMEARWEYLFVTTTGVVGVSRARPDLPRLILAGLFGINYPFLLQRLFGEHPMAYHMIGTAYTANHRFGHDFIEDSALAADWRLFRKDGLEEFVIK
ncbi:hypothetical protein BCR34DRAFT_69333 [Clohesyomyces aquaticus]|uniref:Uncharacterized protein n=1 Tax=Clohesyomyces aquaticus TaxID=1231657 RepID=A0A1Y1Z059_9PLEO|nr:hypothetical protein BCR34DRAFT_69333 [Clohesyomyces aquaticus]